MQYHSQDFIPDMNPKSAILNLHRLPIWIVTVYLIGINPGEKVTPNIFLNNLAGEINLRAVMPGQAVIVRESYVGLKNGIEGCMKFE